jgi:hypothetical protein
MAIEQWSQAIAKYQEILELEPTHNQASRQLEKAKEGLETQNKISAEAGKRTSRTKPSSLPEAIKPLKPETPPEEIKSRNSSRGNKVPEKAQRFTKITDK